MMCLSSALIARTCIKSLVGNSFEIFDVARIPQRPFRATQIGSVLTRYEKKVSATVCDENLLAICRERDPLKLI